MTTSTTNEKKLLQSSAFTFSIVFNLSEDNDDDNDGIPDCADWDGFENLAEEWKCGNNNNKVVICHIPPGNPSNAHTITISQSAVQAHLAHGDSLGPCGGNRMTSSSSSSSSSSDSDDSDKDDDDDGW